MASLSYYPFFSFPIEPWIVFYYNKGCARHVFRVKIMINKEQLAVVMNERFYDQKPGSIEPTGSSIINDNPHQPKPGQTILTDSINK